MHVHMELKGNEEWRDSVMPARINALLNEFWTDQLTTGGENEEPISPDGTAIPLLASFLGSAVLASNCTKSKLVYLDIIQIFSSLPNCEDQTISDYILPYVYELIMSGVIRKRSMECASAILSNLKTAETGLFSEYLFPICMSLDSPDVIAFAASLGVQALRLSQPDEEGKKKEAIRSFIERVINRAMHENWTIPLIENAAAIFTLLPPSKIEDLLMKKIIEWTTFDEPDISIALCQSLPKMSKILSPKHLPYIVGLLLNHIDASVPESVMLAAINALGDMGLVEKKNSNFFRSSGVKIASKLIPLMYHPWTAIHATTQTVLVDTIGGQCMSPVDQFVFLRHLLPEGCRTLLDLSTSRKAPAIIPVRMENFEKLRLLKEANDLLPFLSSKNEKDGIVALSSLGRWPIASSTAISTPIPGASGYHVPISLVNPLYRSPRMPEMVAQLETTSLSGTLRNHEDWRIEISASPRPLPDLGCLSNSDGSLMSIYSGTTSSGLQSRFISTLACVPPRYTSGGGWKPENLLLATLNDFSIGGVAVPVVSVDTTDDGRIIFGAGADSTVKLWRTPALETEAVMSCSKSWNLPCSRLYCIRTMRNTKSFAAGLDDRIGIFRADQSGDHPAVSSPIHAFGHVIVLENFDTDLSSCVMGGCEKGGIVCWDIRTNSWSWILERDVLRTMVPTGIVISKDARSFAISSLNGYITVYDNRYLKPVSNFQAPGGITTISPSSSEDGKNIWVSTGSDICLFDIENGGVAKQVLSTLPPNSPTTSVPVLVEKKPELNTDFSISKVVKSETNARCVRECAGGGKQQFSWTLVSGHNDGVARYWQPNDQASGVVCPLQLDPTPAVVNGSIITQQVVRDRDFSLDESQAWAGRPCTVTEGHRDVINDISFASLQYDVIVTAGRDGMVKLWK